MFVYILFILVFLALTPLTRDQMEYSPTPMEKKVHWWSPERKRKEPSPEAGISTNDLTIPSLCRLIETSCLAVADLASKQFRGQEIIDRGSTTAFVDFMMDTMFGSMGNLFYLASQLPLMAQKEVQQQRAVMNLDFVPIID